MPRHQIVIDQTFPFSVDKLYGFLSDHENLGALFPAKVRRVKDGQDSVNGVGSVRRLTMPGGVSLEETVTKAEPGKLIEYTITKGGWPARNHYGVMRFEAGGQQASRLHYTIEFDGAPQIAGWVLKHVLGNAIGSGLRKLAKRGL